MLLPRIVVLLWLFSIVSPLNILVYSPAYAASHSNFLGKLADTLTEKGHNVTFLIPVIEIEKRDECVGVKLTKDVVFVDAGEEMVAQEVNTVPIDDVIGSYWQLELDSSNIDENFKWFGDSFKVGCRNFHQRRDVFEEMKTRNFDVAILEPISVCGLGFVKALGIEKTILASSCVFYDAVVANVGEPLDYSSVPAGFVSSGDRMSMAERYENYVFTERMIRMFERMFDGEMESYREFRGGDLPDWRELLAAASVFFVNSSPFLDFPRTVLQKTIPIGGISVNLEWIKAQRLDEEWEEVLGRRSHSMLISFGSMAKSMYMPKEWRSGLLETIKSMPNVTFIWKYESTDVTWADAVPNIHFSKWVPQTALLNDDRLTAFVSHGGLGSTMELAYSGKPAVMVPIFGDQVRNANMLARHQGVISFRKRDLESVEKTRDAFHRVLFDGSYKKNARKLADILENQPNSPKDTVIKYTEFVGEHGPFPQTDPCSRRLNVFQRTFLDIYCLFAVAILIVTGVSVLIVRGVYRKMMVRKALKTE